jgi:hypothetical protein
VLDVKVKVWLETDTAGELVAVLEQLSELILVRIGRVLFC